MYFVNIIARITYFNPFFLAILFSGGILHIHEPAMVSTDFLVSLTYWPDLWQQATHTNDTGYRINAFRFSRTKPTIKHTDEKMEWRLVSDVRKEMSAQVYDEIVHNVFTLFNKNINPMVQFKDANAVWKRFQGMFSFVNAFLVFMPSRLAYFKQALKEMHDDNVQYVEIRTSLKEVILLTF